MPLNVKAGSFAANVVTGSQSVTGLGFKPKVVIFFGNMQTVDGSGTDASLMFGVGISSSLRRAISARATDNTSGNPNASSAQIASCIYAPDGSFSADFVSQDNDGFTITWATAPGSAIIINYIALGGSDLANATLQSLTTPSVTGNQAYTGFGFKPDCAIFFLAHSEVTETFSNNTAAQHQYLGFAASTSQRGYAAIRRSNAAGAAAKHRQSKSKCVAVLTGAAGVNWEADLASFDSDGLTLNYTTAVAEADFFYCLALKGPRFKVGSIAQPGSTGNQATTGIGFQPAGLFLLSNNDTAANDDAGQANARISIGAGSGSANRFCIWNGDTDAASPTVCKQNLDRTKIIKLLTEGATPTVNAAADLASFDADGFTLNWTTVDATAREILYLAFAGSPLTSNDFPNPPGKPPIVRDFNQRTPTHLIGKDQFFTSAGRSPVYDWPNPRGAVYPVELRTYINPIELQLAGKDKFFYASGEAPVYEWAVPKGKTYPNELRVFNNPSKAHLFSLDSFFGAAGEAPTYEPPPNPVAKAYPQELRTFINAMEGQLIGQDQVYGGPGQPPTYQSPANPNGKIYPADLRTFINPAEVQLIGQDTFFGAAGQPPPSIEWIVPRARSVPNELCSWLLNLLQATLAPTLVPFHLMDWPNPRSVQPSIELRTFLNAAETQLIGLDQFFASPGMAAVYDWSVPKAKPHPAELRTWTQGLYTAFLIAPFAQNEWPIPSGKLYPNELRTWALNTLNTLVIVAPFSLTDWPNPLRPGDRINLRTFVEGVRQQLLSQDQFFGLAGQPPSYAPPAPPPGRIYPPDLRTFINPIARQLIGQDQLFAAPGQVITYQPPPNPRGAAHPSDLRTFVDALKLHLQGQDQIYGAAGQAPAFDWPLPKGKTGSIDLRGWTQGLFTGFLTPPFAQYDWPIPKGKEQLVDLRSWLITLLETTLALDYPFNLSDWPNPIVVPVRASELRLWLTAFQASALSTGRIISIQPSDRGIEIKADDRIIIVGPNDRLIEIE